MRVVLTIIAGALSGAVASWGVVTLLNAKRGDDRPRVGPETSAEGTKATSYPATIVRVVDRSGECEGPAAAPSAKPVEPVLRKVSPPQASTANMVREQQGRVEAHKQEPRNSVWATGMERTLGDGIRALQGAGSLGADIGSLDCRYESCLAELRWRDSGKAKTELYNFVASAGTFTVGCTQHISLDESTGQVASWIVQCSEDSSVEESEPMKEGTNERK